jgi:hypothetical protein
MQNTRCCWEGCWRSTTRPMFDGSYLFNWGPHIQDGWYCKAHADAIEAVSDEGGLEEDAPC